MREREHGASSITFLRSVYYALKVTLALLVAMGRRYAVPSEGVPAMTPVRISIAAAIGSVLLILIVLELIRGRRLKERYALLWLVTGIVLLVLSAWRGGLNTIAGLARRVGLPAGDPLRGGDHVRHRRPPALLDRALAADRRQRPARAGGRAPAHTPRRPRGGRARTAGRVDASYEARRNSRTSTTRRRTRRMFLESRSQAAQGSTWSPSHPEARTGSGP